MVRRSLTAGLVALAASLGLPAAVAADVGFIKQWGSRGEGDGQFRGPRGVAVDAGGAVYVMDFGNSRVQKFSPNGDFRGKFGSHGNAPGQIDGGVDVAVDRSGMVYVAERDNARIEKLSPDGTLLGSFGSSGQGAGQFVTLDKIAVDGAGNVYAADTDREKVVKFGPNGSVLLEWGGPPGDFSPQGVAADDAGNVYVGDGQRGVAKYSSNGALRGHLKPPARFGYFSPLDVATTPGGGVWASAGAGGGGGGEAVVHFSASGAFVEGYGKSGNGPGEWASPHGIAADGSGNVYVADRANERIQKLGPGGRSLRPNPRVEALSLSPTRFRPAARGGSLAVRTGTSIRYRVSERATVRFAVQRAAAGREGGGRCQRPSRRNRRNRRCTRYIALRSGFSRRSGIGANAVRFTGRLRGRRLAPARYRLVARASAGGRRGGPRLAHFRVVR